MNCFISCNTLPACRILFFGHLKTCEGVVLLSDSEIIRRVKKGKSDDFSEIISRYQRKALSLAYRMLGNWDDAEDAVQDACVNSFKGLRTFNERSKFWIWFRKIVVNCCLKKISRKVTHDNIDTVLETTAEPYIDSIEEGVLKTCEMETVRAAILDLPPHYRIVVVLKYQEDLSTPEIADALDLSAGIVRVRLHRALKMLAKRLVVIPDEV